MNSTPATSSIPRLLFIDLEISKSLYAKFPSKRPEYNSYKDLLKDWFLICAAWKRPEDKNASSCSILENVSLDMTNDLVVVKALYDEIAKSDVIIGHNISKFDWPKFYARTLYHDLKPLAKPKILDTIKMAKSIGEFTSNSLAYLNEFLGLPGKAELSPDAWNGLILCLLEQDTVGFRVLVDEIEKYCKPDVIACEALYNRLLPHMAPKNRVNMNAYDNTCGCEGCGSKKLQKRGLTPPTTAGYRYQRYQCTDCGAWSQSKRSE